MLDVPLLVGLRVLLLFGNAKVAGRTVFVDEDDSLLALLVGGDPFALLQEHARGVDVLPDHHELPTGHAHSTSSFSVAGRAMWSLPKKVFAQALVPRRTLSLKTTGPSSIVSSDRKSTRLN